MLALRSVEIMRKIVIGVITVSLAIIALVMSYGLWTDYKKAREAETALANMEANKPERFKVVVPPEDSRASESPTQLVVSVYESGALMLNAQQAGTISDMSQLRSKLEQVFHERGDQQPDRAVFVRTPRTLKYAEVTKVIDVVKQAGAYPVGLQVGDL
jgi:biopolymer transport protein ExbD